MQNPTPIKPVPAAPATAAPAGAPQQPAQGPKTAPGQSGAGQGGAGQGPQAGGPAQAPKAASLARPKTRHYGLAASFLLMVLLPLAGVIYYLYAVAADQYVSRVGFAVRSEEIRSAQDLLGGLSSSLAGSSSSDTNILYEFIQSQDLVQQIDEDLDLEAIFSRPEFDPVFAYRPTGDIEDLVSYWQKMVKVHYDSSSGLIELQTHAFRPEDALAISETIMARSTVMINNLSAIAREDATRYALEELEEAVERLKTAREAITRFRSETRIVDPEADVQGQMGLLNSLEGQLAEAQIERSLLSETVTDSDPRMDQADRRIAVIEGMIESERAKFGIGGESGPDGQDYSTLVGEFERLTVDRRYAEETYIAAQATLDSARAEAQRQSRYLAVYASPTLPQSARYPQRELLTLEIGLFLLLGWAVMVLIYYSLRDRR